VGAVEDVAKMIADAMTGWATWGIEMSIRLLGGEVLPDTSLFFEGPVSLLFGANYGLALLIIRALVVISILVTAIAAFRQRQTEFAGNVLSAILWLFLFSALFFPVYTLMLSSLREISVVVLENAADTSDSSLEKLTESLSALLNPGNLVMQFLTGLVNGALATVLITELGAMVVAGVILSIFYPLSIAFRPFGKLGLNQFRLTTAAVISIPLSLLFMMGLLAMELVLIQASNSVAPFLGAYANFLLSLIFGLAIVLLPLGVFSLAYTKVAEMVGSTDAKIQSGVNVLTMPDINSRNISEDATRDRLMYVKQFASELPGAIAAGENSPATEAKELGKQIAIKAATTSGHPIVVGAAAAYTGLKVVGKIKKSMSHDGGETSHE
ncbi:MAG: hypothetical protein ABIR46_01055, partial [Candidatus Saccharimonadales bacterium]